MRRDGLRRRSRGESALTTEDGDSDELRSGSSETEEGLGGESTLEGYPPGLHRRGRRSLARVGPYRAHARAARRRETLEARHRGAVRQRPRRDDGQPGYAAGQGGTQGGLPFRLAGRRRRQYLGRDVPGPVALPAQL